MQMRLHPMRTLSLCLVCIVGLGCSSTSSTDSNEGETCGGFAGTRCGADEYCDYADNDCGLAIADGWGTCKPRPQFCTAILSPKCACDGVVYGNECEAARHGVDVSVNDNC